VVYQARLESACSFWLPWVRIPPSPLHYLSLTNISLKVRQACVERVEEVAAEVTAEDVDFQAQYSEESE
jgi:hypothetical protein